MNKMRRTPSSSFPLLLFYISVTLIFFSAFGEQTSFKDVDLENPLLQFRPSLIAGYSSSHGDKVIVSCERVRIVGLSRLKIKSYANSFRVTLSPLEVIPERFHSKIEVCFHRNVSTGLCQCENDEWKTNQKGLWSSVLSPYDDKYVDVKFMDGLSGSMTISIEEEFQQWRLLFLALGFFLLLLAPIVSNWVPFYYSSSMALGVLLVVLIILFQGMKLLPTGRKSVFYLTLYGSVLGAGSYLVHYFSTLVNSILVNFGLSEDMHNPVSIFLLLGVILAGAALGYWIVRKFIILEDGSVNVGIAQFVKWAMRSTAVAFILQSTLDTPLAVVALATCWIICFFITSQKWRGKTSMQQEHPATGNLWPRKAKQVSPNRSRAEFLSRTGKMGAKRTSWGSPNSAYAWSNSPAKELVFSSPNKAVTPEPDYYSTFHKTPARKRFSKKEWEDFTRESTRQAMAEWASSPEFTDWIIEHADRIQLLPDDSSDDGMGSGSDSSEETVVESGSRLNLLKWC